MGFLSKLFGKKDDNNKTGGMEDYMQLVRVYFQASIAANVGITNLAALPDLRVFKTTLHVPTVNNKLGVGEKTACRKMLKEIYGTDDLFFSFSMRSCPCSTSCLRRPISSIRWLSEISRCFSRFSFC